MNNFPVEMMFGNLLCGFYLIIPLLGILMTAFWIWMLVDAIQRDYENENDKLIWILVIAFTNWIGALVYYFVIKRK